MSRRKLYMLFFSVHSLAAFCCTFSSAQDKDLLSRVECEIINTIAMLNRNVKGVDDTIELTDEQKHRLAEVRKKFIKNWGQEHRKKDASFHEIASRVCKVTKDELEEVLFPFQLKKVRAIAATQIVRAENRREFYSCDSLVFSSFALKLLEANSEQRAKIDSLKNLYKGKVESLFNKEYKEFEESRIDATRERFGETLSQSQIDTLSNIFGADFEFDKYPKEFKLDRVQTIYQSRRGRAIWFIENNVEGDFKLIGLIEKSLPKSNAILEFAEPLAQELDLTSAQSKQISKLKAEIEAASKLVDPAAKAGRRIPIIKRSAAWEGLEEILVPAQQERLEQLFAQWIMLSFGIEFKLQLKQVRNALSLRPDQQEEIQKRLQILNSDLTQRLRKFVAARNKLGKEANNRLFELLSPNQKDIYNEYFRTEID